MSDDAGADLTDGAADLTDGAAPIAGEIAGAAAVTDGTPDTDDASADITDDAAGAGLCGSCAHGLLRPTRRGTVYLRCALAATDARFARYPRLPVTQCPGYRLGDLSPLTVDHRRP